VESARAGLDPAHAGDAGVGERALEVTAITERHEDLMARVELLLDQRANLRRRQRGDLCEPLLERGDRGIDVEPPGDDRASIVSARAPVM
jgi:hypothetical protein